MFKKNMILKDHFHGIIIMKFCHIWTLTAVSIHFY